MSIGDNLETKRRLEKMRKSTMLYGYDHKNKRAQRFGVSYLCGMYQWYDGDEYTLLTGCELVIANLINHTRNRNDIIMSLKFIDDGRKTAHNAIDYSIEIIDTL